MHSPGNILICYQARGSAGFLDLQRFVKLIYMFSGKTLNIYILSRRLITEESLNLEMKNKYVKLYNINMLKAMRIKANASIFIMPNLLDSFILFSRKIFFRDFKSQFAVIHNPPFQVSSKNIFINIIGITLQYLFYLFSDINIYLSKYVSLNWINNKKSIVQALPDLNPSDLLDIDSQTSPKKNVNLIRFLVIGRWLPYKSLKLLIGALSSIEKSELCTKLLISIKGSSYPENEIKALKKATNNKNIQIEYDDNYIPDSDVDQLLLSCDYCLFLYTKASQSGFMQRCKELSVPVISTRVGGLEEYLINGAKGHSVDPDFESIKFIIKKISNNHPYPFQYQGNINNSNPLIDCLKNEYLKNMY